MRNRPAAALALLALLAAGCASPPAPAAPSSLAPAESAAPLFELSNCTGRFTFFVMDDGAVQAEMPDRYRPYTVQGVAGALVDVEAVQCDVALGGEVEAGVPMAWVSAQVGPSSAYRFEWILPVAQAPRLAAFLAGRGWTVLDAQVQILPGAVSVRGADVDFAILDGGDPAGGVVPTSVEGGFAHLVRDAGGSEIRLDQNQTVDGYRQASAPALVASKGALARFAPGGQASGGGGLSFLGIEFHSAFFEATQDQEQPVRD